MSSDRRRYPRLNAPVFCRPTGKPLFGQQRAQDVSLGGMRLYSDEKAEVSDRLIMDLFLPDGSEISCKVEVVWVEPLEGDRPARFEIGVKFVEIDRDALVRLGSVLQPA